MSELKESRLLSRNSQFLPSKIGNIALLHSKGSSHDRELFADNFFYGHREILLQHANIDWSSQIIGTLQHGVFNEPDMQCTSPRFLWGRKTKFWCFSKLESDRCKARGFAEVSAIGSPWLYLREHILDCTCGNLEEMRDFLIVPSHSTTTEVDVNSLETKRKRASLFRSLIGNASATVCLHFNDFLDWETRLAYEEEDFKVVSAGIGNSRPQWSTAADRVKFLPNLLELMRHHKTYISDGPGSSLIYAIDMEMQIGLYPDIAKELLYSNQHIYTKKPTVEKLGDHLTDWVEREIPDTINTIVKGRDYRDLADRYLGKESLLEPDELERELLYKIGVYPTGGVTKIW